MICSLCSGLHIRVTYTRSNARICYRRFERALVQNYSMFWGDKAKSACLRTKSNREFHKSRERFFCRSLSLTSPGVIHHVAHEFTEVGTVPPSIKRNSQLFSTMPAPSSSFLLIARGYLDRLSMLFVLFQRLDSILPPLHQKGDLFRPEMQFSAPV